MNNPQESNNSLTPNLESTGGAVRKLFQIEHTVKEGVNYFSVVKEWNNIKEVTDTLGFYREGIDQALKKGYISSGYFWMWNYDWESGKKPDISKQIRNKRIYAYEAETKEFINRYKNAVIASKDLSISVSNIRLVCDNEKYKAQRQTHKGYFFSYKPLHEEDDLLADIMGLNELRLEVRDKALIDMQIQEKKQILLEIQKRDQKEINISKYEKKEVFYNPKIDKFY